MDSDVSASMCKNSCLKIMFRVCLYAMTGKECSVNVAWAFSHMCYFTPKHTVLWSLILMMPSWTTKLSIQVSPHYLPITNGFAELMTLPFGLACIQHPKKPSGQIQQANWNPNVKNTCVIFNITQSFQPHNTDDSIWSGLSQSNTTLNNHHTNLCNPGSVI